MATVDATYIAKRSPEQRALLETVRTLIVKTLPSASVTIKWGVPVYAVNGRNVCALSAFKDHVGLNFFAPPDVLLDPKKRLEGAGKTSRMLKIRTATDIDAASISRWLKASTR